MNSGARIKELQGSEENRRLLAAQRQTYTDAKRVDRACVCICLLSPLATTIVQLLAEVPPAALVLVWIATLDAGIILPWKSAKLSAKAARMQQRFDSSVFGVEFENMSRDDSFIASQAERYLERNGSDQTEFDDWYSVDLEGLEPGEAIARCQRQNARWTRLLLKRSLRVEASAALLVIALLAALIIGLGFDPLNLFFLSSVLEWLAQRVTRCLAAIARVDRLEGSQAEFDLSSQENIIRVQEKILECREASYLVPDWLYGHFKKKDESATRAR